MAKNDGTQAVLQVTTAAAAGGQAVKPTAGEIAKSGVMVQHKPGEKIVTDKTVVKCGICLGFNTRPAVVTDKGIGSADRIEGKQADGKAWRRWWCANCQKPIKVAA